MWELRRKAGESHLLLRGVLKAKLFTPAGYRKLANSEENGISVKWQIFVVSGNLMPSSHILLLAYKMSQFVCSRICTPKGNNNQEKRSNHPYKSHPSESLSFYIWLLQTVKLTIMKSFTSKDIFSDSPINHFLLSSTPSSPGLWICTIATTNGVSLMVRAAAEKTPVLKFLQCLVLKRSSPLNWKTNK